MQLTHGEKMTRVPQGFDFSFLNDEEARKILRVLERNEELQRAERDRIRYQADRCLLPAGLRPAGPGRARRRRGTCGRLPNAHRPGASLRGAFPPRMLGCLVDALATHSIPEGLACESRVSCPRHAGGFGACFSGWVLRPRPGRVEGVGRGASRLGWGAGQPRPAVLGGLLGSRGAGAKRPGSWDQRAAWNGILARARTHALTQLQVVALFQHPLPRYQGHLSSPHADSQQGPEKLVPHWWRSGPQWKGWSSGNFPNGGTRMHGVD